MGCPAVCRREPVGGRRGPPGSPIADPADPLGLDSADDSGDHLHPDANGYQAMANPIDLSLVD
jgi:hypothetical protein